ncbi:MAG: sulfite exporter TauE/SafE family protein, partial [Microcella sp.]|nr:sulfite exporter TauE/SafE family protein [Microcella sp.]
MTTLVLVAVVGFVAQLIDGAIGMAFGITSMTVLLALGYGPAAASAVVHLVKIGTGIASGSFHWRFGNVDTRALLKVAVPGGVGAFVGAVLLSSIDFTAASPWTATLLLALGALILVRFSRSSILGVTRRARARWLMPLGLVGGFVDATGGGGWGPIVTTTLTASNALTPRKAIGTTNTAEIVVALAASGGFLVGIGASNIAWDAVLALLIGGIIAAPIAAKLVSIAPQRILGLLTGTVVVLLNVYSLTASLDSPEWVVMVALVAGLVVCALAFRAGLRVHLAEIRESKRSTAADPEGPGSETSGEDPLEKN